MCMALPSWEKNWNKWDVGERRNFLLEIGFDTNRVQDKELAKMTSHDAFTYYVSAARIALRHWGVTNPDRAPRTVSSTKKIIRRRKRLR